LGDVASYWHTLPFNLHYSACPPISFFKRIFCQLLCLERDGSISFCSPTLGSAGHLWVSCFHFTCGLSIIGHGGVMLCVECGQCGVPAENQPFNEGADEVTVRGNVTDVLPAMDQHQPAAVPIEARTPSWLLPLGLGGNNELVGRRAVQKPTRHKNERNARTAR